MKKYIALLIIIGVALGFYISRKAPGKTNTISPKSVEQQLGLPQGWTKVSSENVELKLVKAVTNGLKPQIVLTKDNYKNESGPAKYVDKLIAGARSAIPSLKISKDSRTSEENKYTALISGTYTNKSQKISLIQRVYIIKENVFVLTGSFNGDLAAETNQIMDSIVKDRL